MAPQDVAFPGVCSSRTVSILMEPPRIVASAIKSHVQTWFLCVALVGSPVERPRRGPSSFVGVAPLRPSSRRKRRTWRLPTFQPLPALSRAAIRRYPYRGFSSSERVDALHQAPEAGSIAVPPYTSSPTSTARGSRHPARRMHTPSLTAACTTSFLCAGPTIFFEGVLQDLLGQASASASIFLCSCSRSSSSLSLLASSFKSMWHNCLFQRWNVTSEMFFFPGRCPRCSVPRRPHPLRCGLSPPSCSVYLSWSGSFLLAQTDSSSGSNRRNHVNEARCQKAPDILRSLVVTNLQAPRRHESSFPISKPTPHRVQQHLVNTPGK